MFSGKNASTVKDVSERQEIKKKKKDRERERKENTVIPTTGVKNCWSDETFDRKLSVDI